LVVRPNPSDCHREGESVSPIQKENEGEEKNARFRILRQHHRLNHLIPPNDPTLRGLGLVLIRQNLGTLFLRDGADVLLFCWNPPVVGAGWDGFNEVRSFEALTLRGWRSGAGIEDDGGEEGVVRELWEGRRVSKELEKGEMLMESKGG
jgi:hypothetical protein